MPLYRMTEEGAERLALSAGEVELGRDSPASSYGGALDLARRARELLAARVDPGSHDLRIVGAWLRSGGPVPWIEVGRLWALVAGPRS